MRREDILQDIKVAFKSDILDTFYKSPDRAYIEIKPGALVKVARHVYEDFKARFNIASGIDCRNHMEILYHFTVDERDLVISFRVKLDKQQPLEIDSLTPLFKGADWIEREIHEILGINFKGHPNLKRLLLPDEWPEGVYPMRRDYKEWDPGAIRDRGV